MNMNYTSNQTYFKPKKALRYVGGVLCLLAVPMIFMRAGAFSLIPFVLGVLCLLVNRELNVRGTDVEEQIKAETDRLSAALEEKYYDVKHPFPKMMITVIGDYVTEGEGLKMRRSSLGKNITSRYHVVAIGTKNGRLYFAEERFSTIDDSDFSENGGEYSFDEIDRVDYALAEGAAVSHFEFAIVKNDGTELFRVPAPTDYTTQKYAEDLNVIFERHRKEREKEKMEQAEKQQEQQSEI